MDRKKLIAVMTAVIIGMAMYGGSGSAMASDAGGVNAAESTEGVNLCPVSGERVDAKTSIAYEYKGKVYHFCCASCAAEFKKDPEKYIEKMKGGKATAEPAHRGDHDHGGHDHE